MTRPRSHIWEVKEPGLDPGSWIPESPLGPLWPQVLCDQSGASEGGGWAGVGGLCPLWAPDVARAYSEERYCLPSGADPRPLPLHSPASRVCCLPLRPPPHRVTPPETFCCVFGPHGTPRPCTPWSRDQPLPHQRLQQGQAHPEASGLWAGPPLAKPTVRDPSALFRHLRLNL